MRACSEDPDCGLAGTKFFCCSSDEEELLEDELLLEELLLEDVELLLEDLEESGMRGVMGQCSR